MDDNWYYDDPRFDSPEEQGRYEYRPPPPAPAPDPYDPWAAAGQQPPPTTPPKPGHIWVQMPDGSWVETPNGVHPPGDDGLNVPPQGAVPPPPPRSGDTPPPPGPSVPPPSGGGFGAAPDYSSRLPFSPYEDSGPFVPSDPVFEDDPFTPSSWEDAENEPGFTKAQDRLSKQVQNSAAYRGMVRSGMTIGNLDSVLDSNRGQNFAQFDARRFRNWQGNRDDAFRGWQARYGVDRDVYDRGAQNVDRRNTFRFNTERESFSAELQRWQEQVRSLTSLARPVA